MDNNAALRRHAEALDPSAWTRLERAPKYVTKTGTTRARRDNVKSRSSSPTRYVNLELNHEDVAEFTYQPTKCRKTYRVVVLRKNISRSKGEQVLIDEIRYFFYITTYKATTHDHTAQVVELANDRCDQENIHGQLKSGLNALHAPVGDLNSNWAYMVIAALAWNIKSWHAMMMHRVEDRSAHIRMEFKRFLDTIIRIPAMVLNRARRIVIRVRCLHRQLDRLFSAWTTIERIRLAGSTGPAAANPRPRHPTPRRDPATAMPRAQHRKSPPLRIQTKPQTGSTRRSHSGRPDNPEIRDRLRRPSPPQTSATRTSLV